jgi:hypothetical protein
MNSRSSAIFAILCFLAGCAAPEEAVPASNPQTPPMQERFPIMCWDGLRADWAPWDDPHAGLSSLAECHYSIAGFVRPEHLPACEKLGLNAIVRPANHPIKWRELSDAQIEAVVRQMVEESRGSRAVIGYFIMDEPGVVNFPALAKAVAAVKKLAPGKLAYINLYPNYATLGAPNLSQLGTANYTEYLERFVSEVKPQFISYDNYRILTSDELRKPQAAESYFANLLEVRRVAQEHNLPFWNICSSNQIRPFTPPPSPANLQLQAYTTLAAGASNLTWFTYYARGYGYAPIDKNRHRTATWSYVQAVNRQVATVGPIVRKLRSTGVYFTAPAPAASLPLLPGKVIERIESPTPLMIGEFTDAAGSASYAMVVNLGLDRSSKIKITPAHGLSIDHYISPADGSALALDDDNSLWLTAGQGALIATKK